MANTILGDVLSKAFEDKKNDLTKYIWRGEKKIINGEKVQDEFRLVDADLDTLRKCYQHCDTMLNNTDKENPGRYVLLDIIKDQRVRCDVELFLRYLEHPANTNRQSTSRYRFREIIQHFLDDNEFTDEDGNPISANEWAKISTIDNIMSGSDEEFNKYTYLPINLVMNGCVGALGTFNRKHITLSFITKLGIWLTPQEKNEFNKRDENGKLIDRLVQVSTKLNLKDRVKLHLKDTTGLSYAEFEAMYKLRNVKYSDMTTLQLNTLRNKVLFTLENEVRFHARQWEERKRQILRVAESKGWTL